ncbi:MAG: hypothetical protein JWL59_751 [Chthoniobacteraceae bacterium]|nr:hypothetical protein [Chthoniobacteraceae bacterium]
MAGPRGGRGAGSVGEAGTVQARANAKDALSRTTQAVQAVQAMQTAARNLARNGPNNLSQPGRPLPNVPNGLVIGGLQVAPGVPVNPGKPVAGEDSSLWQGAALPTQSIRGERTTVTIKQTAQQALLTWQTFNIGKNTTLSFDQSKGGASKGEWIAFNRVIDPSGVPSQILGSIEAGGQVYVINQNGIIFGGNSQVNAHAFVASALPINDNLLARGLLNNADSQFLFSGLKIEAGKQPAFIPSVTDAAFTVSDSLPAYKLAQPVVAGSTPVVKIASSKTALDPALDYTLSPDADGRTVLTFTPAGLVKVGTASLLVSYTSATTRYGDVIVQKGAQLTSPTTAEHTGGKIALIGANVRNDGTISTPDGQTILAAGLQVGLAAHPKADPSLRGLDVFIGAVTDSGSVLKPYAGTATNGGLIDAPRANITIAGKTVQQLGVIESSTSVSLNGRIDLLASYDAVSSLGLLNLPPFFPKSAGTVTLGAHSVSRILPEVENPETTIGFKLPLLSQVKIQGHTIHLGAEAAIFAPNADVSLSAGVWTLDQSSQIPANKFVYAGGQIYLDAGATINVAGTPDVSAPISENILSVELRGAELADSPLQRTGPLRGPTLSIDLRKTGIWNGQAWVGTPLGNAAGYAGLIQRTAAALTTAGGTVALRAGDSVVLQAGSKIDVSGGWTNYQGGMVTTTRVVSGGQIVDISQATPDRIYEGIYTGTFTTAHPKYGISETFTNALLLNGAHFEEGYIEGANGGTINIAAASMALDGTLLGNTVSGPRQRTTAATQSALSLVFQSQTLAPPDFAVESPKPPSIVFSPNLMLPAADPFELDALGNPLPLRDERQKKVILSPELLAANGFGNLFVDNGDGDILIPKSAAITTAAGGSLTLRAKNLDIQGNVTAPGGTLNFSVFNISPFLVAGLTVTPAADPLRGHFTLGATGSLSTAGLIVDDRYSPVSEFKPLVLNGGPISIVTYSADLAAGSLIDVSGGVAMSVTGKRSYGDGGSISIAAGQDPNVLSTLGGELNLQAILKGFSGAKAGALSIKAPLIQIGGTTANADTLLLSPQFFSEGGFGSFSLSGIGARTGVSGEFLPGIFIAPNTVIKPVAESLVAAANTPGANGVVLVPVLKPEGLRTPVSLFFNATGVTDTVFKTLVIRGDAVMGAGAIIETDAKGSVSIGGDTASVMGTIIAPGGNIAITGSNAFPSLQTLTQALATVHLGPQSYLSTAGSTLLTENSYGYRTGTVLAGGTITVAGNLVAESGAVLDVSGSSAMLDVSPSYLGMPVPGAPLIGANSGITAPLFNLVMARTRIDSDGGSLVLKGGQELFTDATLLGAAGGPNALGGTLTVSSGRYDDPNIVLSQKTALNPTLLVTQAGVNIPSAFADGTAIGKSVLDASGNAIAGLGHFSANTFMNGGFDSLTLRGTVQFSGPVSISARSRLSVADSGVMLGDSTIFLAAPYVALGQAFLPPRPVANQLLPFVDGANRPASIPATYGHAELTVKADLIDVGNLSMQHFGKVNLSAGDIRGDGTFDVAGDITLRAAQIYPTSAASFTIAAYNHALGDETVPGSVTIIGSGSAPLPFSAGGQLNIFGSVIHQGGVLRAPIGSINLGLDETSTLKDPLTGALFATTKSVTLSSGSITSVSAVDPLTGQGLLLPYGINLNGTSWIDPIGTDITASGVPGKTINITGASVNDQRGSIIDLGGGGDLYAYRFVGGIGGSADILGSASAPWSASVTYAANTLVSYQGATWSARQSNVNSAPSASQNWRLIPASFAVIPGYAANYAPYAPYSDNPITGNLGSDPGYTGGNLSVGDQVYLGASGGLAAGTYTLLPARYALMPGAFLVTPRAGAPVGTVSMPDGATYVPGYRFNDLNTERAGHPLMAWFEVDSGAVVNSRAQYDNFFANKALRDGAQKLGGAVPRLPVDAGQLVLQASTAITFNGHVTAQAPNGGRGGLVDISSPVDIYIGTQSKHGPAGTLFLDAAQLSAFGAESLLIGGVRHAGLNGQTVAVRTGNLTLDNAGTPLVGSDIIFVTNNSLTLEPGARIVQSGTLSGRADTLLLSGNGTLLRVSADPAAATVRSNVTGTTTPTMSIGADTRLSGASITLDSTGATTLDPNAHLDAGTMKIASGRIILQLGDGSAALQDPGLVLTGGVLDDLKGAHVLSLLSYSSIDLYGTGTFSTSGQLALHTRQIRGFDTGAISIAAGKISLDNAAGGALPALPIVPLDGTLEFNARRIVLGKNALQIGRFADVALNASGSIFFTGTGSLSTQGALTLSTPSILGSKLADRTITAGGALVIKSPGGQSGASGGGLGARLVLEGTRVTASSGIVLPSGMLTLHATGSGPDDDVIIGGRLDVGGTSQAIYDLIRYTDGGRISLISDHGSVTMADGSTVSVNAQVGGGNAGSVSISARNGDFTAALSARMLGSGGDGGAFSLDVGALPDLAPLSTLLGDSFAESRTLRVRTGDVVVDSVVRTHHFNLSADHGSITVSGLGTIDASGATGGSIALEASGSVSLAAGSLLTVHGIDFDHAGKGGAITLEAGGYVGGAVDPNAMLDIAAGSTLDLGVTGNTAASAGIGHFGGTLHLRAPQTSGNTEIQINAVSGTITGASVITVEGSQVFDLSATGGAITRSGVIQSSGGKIESGAVNVRGSINDNGALFAGGTSSTGVVMPGNSIIISNRLLAGNTQQAELAELLTIVPGAEIINSAGDLTLGSTGNSAADDWNLATLRFGPKSAPGVLTLRASGNLVFLNTLSDGFTSAAYTAQLQTQNTLLSANAQSWSYRLAAGADVNAADFHQVMPTVAADSGSLLLGKYGGLNIADSPGSSATTASSVAGRFQVIRTGSGDIDIATAGNVLLLNQFATIYTAGTRLVDPTMGGTFDLPRPSANGGQADLGAVQQTTPHVPQYSLGGGNVTISALGDIRHQTLDINSNVIADSERELPVNWLNRRGYIDPLTGQFGRARSASGDFASTSWWVDFSNFFEGVGALGGGNVTMIAGHDVINVDGLVPTNARMPKGFPDASQLVELGGGDLIVRAGHNIDGGVYYVERGHGTLAAGNEITTNATRSPSLTIIANQEPLAKETWLPTTLFLGKGSFDVTATGNLLLGPVANPFLLPEGYNNSFWNKTYFSSYGTGDAVNVTSLSGAVTLRTGTTHPQGGASTPILQTWLEHVLLLTNAGDTVSNYQPWLRLNETSVAPFQTVVGLMPGTLRVTAFSGDINLVGAITLSPSPTGSVELAASGSINGLQPNGVATLFGAPVTTWDSASINLSDADPASIPGITSPHAFQLFAGTNVAVARATLDSFLSFIDVYFAESGSTEAVLETKQALHAQGLLHAPNPNDPNDPNHAPIHLYSAKGDISGLSLFSGKAARIIAGRDLTDIALYVQNVDENDISVISAGRDIVAYQPNSPLRIAAQAPGNFIHSNSPNLAGDLQISGPGALEVLAGRNLDLGVGPGKGDGTGVGIASIGNARNASLPFEGSDIVVAAGIGSSFGLSESRLDIAGFLAASGADIARLLPELEITGELSPDAQAQAALELFYLVLRNAGRDHALTGDYAAGFNAINALFPDGDYRGDITLTSREIKTKSGGNISILAPGGGLTVGFDIAGSQPLDQGILTEDGGSISIFTRDNVIVGTSRIFTLRGGDEVIWSSEGDIAAGASSKTVQSAPPTRVLVDPQSADVQTDLAGLATGGGIGVLATVKGVAPGNVDLIAPKGTVDAGDAGIRVSGNLNIAASLVLNASNIAVAGTSAGAPSSGPVSAPSLASVSTPTSTTQQQSNPAEDERKREREAQQEAPPSIITVEVLGYGGGEGTSDPSEEEERRKKAAQVVTPEN